MAVAVMFFFMAVAVPVLMFFFMGMIASVLMLPMRVIVVAEVLS